MTMSLAQRQSCVRLWHHHGGGETYLTFRRRFRLHFEYFGGFVPCGIFIGIEIDGHAHS